MSSAPSVYRGRDEARPEPYVAGRPGDRRAYLAVAYVVNFLGDPSFPCWCRWVLGVDVGESASTCLASDRYGAGDFSVVVGERRFMREFLDGRWP